MRLAAAAALVLAAAALTSCGGDDGESSINDEEAVERMVAVAAASGANPESCLRFNTRHFLESTTQLEGDAAVEACEEIALDPTTGQPEQVDVSRTEVEGDTATAFVSFEGSVLDGQTVHYGFVARGERWKFDEMLAFIDFDAGRLVMELGREFMLRAEGAREAGYSACLIDQMEELSEGILEEMMLGGNQEPLLELADGCFTGSSST